MPLAAKESEFLFAERRKGHAVVFDLSENRCQSVAKRSGSL